MHNSHEKANLHKTKPIENLKKKKKELPNEDQQLYS